MKTLVIVLLAIFATSSGDSSGLLLPPLTLTPIEISSQYHSQDGLGQYAYGYKNGLSSKIEIKSSDGLTRGGYTYIDAEGRLQSVEYSSDSINGFRVAATNLPKGPSEEAKARHAEHHEENEDGITVVKRVDNAQIIPQILPLHRFSYGVNTALVQPYIASPVIFGLPVPVAKASAEEIRSRRS